MKIVEIIDQIKLTTEKIHKHEAASVPLIIDQARLMVELKSKAPKRWQKLCKEELGIDPRVAQRYLKIGENWSSDDATPGSDLLEKLPPSLHKLEALCQLTIDQLTQLCEKHDLRKLEREKVIADAREMLSIKPKKKKSTSPVASIRDKWNAFETRLLKELRGLNAKDRRKFADDIEDLLQQLGESMEEALNSSAPENDAEEEEKVEPPEDGDEEGQEDEQLDGKGEDGGDEELDGELVGGDEEESPKRPKVDKRNPTKANLKTRLDAR